jgi:hypothetical protein
VGAILAGASGEIAGMARMSAGASVMLTRTVLNTAAQEQAASAGIQSRGKTAVAWKAAARTRPDMMMVWPESRTAR